MIVEEWYIDLLSRLADDAEIDFWTNAWQTGLADELLVEEFLQSDEFESSAKTVVCDVADIDLFLDRP